MNRKKHRLLPAIAPMLLALSFLTSGCVEPLDPSLRGSTDPNAVSLPIRLYIPNAMPATKAGAGDVSGVSPESQVYRVQVWMFDHQAATETAGDGEKAVAYAEADLSTSNTQNMGPYDQSGYYATWESAKIFRLPLMIPGYVLEREAAKMKFDFYVLANAASIGSTAGRETTRGDLKALTFGYTSTTVDPFGPYGPKTGTTPTNALGTSGLPISGFFNKSKNASAQSPSVGSDDGVDLSFLRDKNKPGTNPPRPYTNDEINAMSPVVQLERAVSKIRFVFAAPSGMTGMSVTGIEVNGGLIPKQTYLFPREKSTTKFELPTNAADATYDAKTISVTVPATIPATIVDPNYLRSTCDSTEFKVGEVTYYENSLNPKHMSAEQYDKLLTAAVTGGLATETYVYLRESDKPITGKIKFKLSAASDAPEYTATFDMSKIDGYTAANTNFHRNHSWIVYAYFQGDGLYIRPVVLPWVDEVLYKYEQQGSAVVAVSKKKEALFGYGWTTSNDNPWWQAHQNYNPAVTTEWYFRHQDDVSTWAYDWVHSQIVSAPGRNAANVPIYANRIELRTSGFDSGTTLHLKLSNPDNFYIVTYSLASSQYVVWAEDLAGVEGSGVPTGWTEDEGAEVLRNGTSYFYVVPKAEPTASSTEDSRKTGMYLVSMTTGGSVSQMIPFNAGAFPGSQTNTEIYFYSVPVNTFKGYYTSRPADIKVFTYDENATPDKAHEVILP